MESLLTAMGTESHGGSNSHGPLAGMPGVPSACSEEEGEAGGEGACAK
jgi:hypothetical protein